MKRAIVLLPLLSLIIMGAFSLRAQHQDKEANQAMVSVYQYPDFLQKPLVEITALKVNGKDIQPGRQFVATEDWLKDFTITIRNTSQQTIKYIEAEFEFPYDGKGNPILPNVGLLAGQRFYVAPAIAAREGEELTLKPSETVGFSIFPAVVGDVQQQMKEKEVSQDVLNRATLRIIIVAFDNDTGWSIGYPTRRDPNNPNIWRQDDGETDDAPPERGAQRTNKEQSGDKSVNPNDFEPRTCYRFDTTEFVSCGTAGCVGWSFQAQSGHYRI